MSRNPPITNFIQDGFFSRNAAYQLKSKPKKHYEDFLIKPQDSKEEKQELQQFKLNNYRISELISLSKKKTLLSANPKDSCNSDSVETKLPQSVLTNRTQGTSNPHSKMNTLKSFLQQNVTNVKPKSSQEIVDKFATSNSFRTITDDKVSFHELNELKSDRAYSKFPNENGFGRTIQSFNFEGSGKALEEIGLFKRKKSLSNVPNIQIDTRIPEKEAMPSAENQTPADTFVRKFIQKEKLDISSDSPKKSPYKKHFTVGNFSANETQEPKESEQTTKDHKDIANFLKKDPSQNFIFSKRKEAAKLLQLLESNLDLLKTQPQPIDPQATWNNLKEIYHTCFNEISKQIAAECQERGEIITRIWKGLETLYLEEKEAYLEEKAKTQEFHEETCNRIHRMYRDMMFDKERNIQENDVQMKDLSTSLNELKAESKRQLEKESNLNKKLSQYKQALLYLNRRVKTLSQENEAWKSAKEPQFLKLKAQQGGSSRNLLLKNFSDDRKSMHKMSGHLGSKAYMDDRKESVDSLSSVHSEEEEEDDIFIVEKGKDEVRVADLNKVAVASIPEQNRAELLREVETCIDEQFLQMNYCTKTTQSEITLIGERFDKAFLSNTTILDMVDDFLYKLEVEKIVDEVSDDMNSNLIISKLNKFAGLIGEEHNIKEEDDDNQNSPKAQKEKATRPPPIHINLLKPQVNYDSNPSPTGHFQKVSKAVNKMMLVKSLGTSDQRGSRHKIREDLKNKNLLSLEEIKEMALRRKSKIFLKDDSDKKEQKRRSLIVDTQAGKELSDDTPETFLLKMPEPLRRVSSAHQARSTINEPEIFSKSISVENIIEVPVMVEKFNLEGVNQLKRRSTGNERYLKVEQEIIDVVQSENIFQKDKIEENEKSSLTANGDEKLNESESASDDEKITLSSSSEDLEKNMNDKFVGGLRVITEGDLDEEKDQAQDFKEIHEKSKQRLWQSMDLKDSPVIGTNNLKEARKKIRDKFDSRKGTLELRKISLKNLDPNKIDSRKLELVKLLSRDDNEEEKEENFNEEDNLGESLNDYMSHPSNPMNLQLGVNMQMKADILKVMKLYKTVSAKVNHVGEKLRQSEEKNELEMAVRIKAEERNGQLQKNNDELSNELKELKATIARLEEQQRRSPLITMLQRESPRESLIGLKTPSSGEKSEYKKRSSIKRDLKNFTNIKIQQRMLGKKVAVEYEHQKIGNHGAQLLEKLITKKMAKFKNFMHIKLVFKQIFMIYSERMTQSKDNPMIKEVSLANFSYNFFLGLFGFKKIADQKFIIFILSLRKYMSYFRVNMFSRFLGCEEGNKYTNDEFNKYIEALDFTLFISNLGNPITNLESDQRFLIPYIRAMQYTGLFADTRVTPEENTELRQDIEKLKENDPKNINKNGVIDFDIYLERLLAKYRQMVNRAKTYVINAFAACDLDGNKMCNIDEFLLLNRHIEPEKFEQDNLEKIFMESADIENDGEKNLSFEKFSVVCVEYNLFSDESQNKYLGIDHVKRGKEESELYNMMKDVRKIWLSKKFDITKRLERLTVLSKEELDNWLKIVEVLDSRITGETKDLKPTLIAYNLLEKETDMLLETQEEYEEKLHQEEEEREKQRITELQKTYDIV